MIAHAIAWSAGIAAGTALWTLAGIWALEQPVGQAALVMAIGMGL